MMMYSEVSLLIFSVLVGPQQCMHLWWTVKELRCISFQVLKLFFVEVDWVKCQRMALMFFCPSALLKVTWSQHWRHWWW